MKKGDKILYLLLIALTALSASFAAVHYSGGGKAAQDNMTLDISVNGKVIRSISLSEIKEETLIKIPCADGHNIISVSRERVRMVSADCRGGDCLREPSLTSDRGIIVCMPHKLTLKLRRASGKSKHKEAVSLDAISY